MADAIYDVVIVGGGHHGTIMGALLADAGLSVAMFERQRELGGGACAEEQPLPGFVQNICSHYTRFWSHPSYKKLNLREHGLHYVMSGNQEGRGCIGMVLDDGKCIVGYPAFIIKDIDAMDFEMSHKNVAKTLGEIARFSKRDSGVVEKYLNLFLTKMLKAFHEYEYNPPPPWGVPGPIESLVDEKDGIPPEYAAYTVRKLAFDMFESPEMQLYYMRMNFGATGCTPNDVPGLYGFIRSLVTIFAVESTSICYGGSHAITHALQRAFSARGGEFFVMKEVDKVLIENGRAAGVRLVDGTEVKARKFVVSDLGVGQTILRLIGEGDVPEQVAHRVKGMNYDRAQLYWGDFAVHELPQYNAADFNPDIQDPQILFLCENDVDYFLDYWEHEAFIKGYSQRNCISVGCDTRWDPTRAPDGKHSFKFDDIAPPLRYLSEDQWLKNTKEIVPNKILDFWQKLAPNMTRDNIIGHYFVSPYDVAKRNIDMVQGGWCSAAMMTEQMERLRPFPELSGYRTPVKDLYMCGADVHPGGGTGRGNEICCYKVIAEDHDLPPIEGA